MTGPSTTLSPLPALLRKAAVDSGFDLEPEMEGGWWRLRASGLPGVAWLRPMSGGAGALLALPIAMPLDDLGLSTAGASAEVSLPRGAADAVACRSPHDLHRALLRVRAARLSGPATTEAAWDDAVLQAVASAPDLTPQVAITEAIAAVRRRIGQDLYRQALFALWEGRCAVTGLAVPELLRASHAKPWAESTNAERLDPFNGLLLTVHLDALFDRGLLTFDARGSGVLSSTLDTDALAVLGLSERGIKLRALDVRHGPYLEWHRAHVFRP